MNPKKQMLLDAVRDNPGMTTTELARICSMHPERTQRRLFDLHSKQLIHYHCEDDSPNYRVKTWYSGVRDASCVGRA